VWIEVEKMSTTTAGDVIGVIRAVLTRFGLIVTLVADNGPPFGAEEFRKFLRNNNIRLEHSPPYHPESNGLAERAVQTCKQHLKKTMTQPMTLSQQQKWLHNFLFNYRTTPTTTTGRSPAELVLSYRPQTLLQLIGPPKFTSQKGESRPIKHEFQLGQKVLAKVGKESPKVPGRIWKRLGVNTYLVDTGNNQKRMMHAHQLTASELDDQLHPSMMIEGGVELPSERATDEVRSPIQSEAPNTNNGPSPRIPSPPRRSNRTVKIPERLIYT
jgi:hypothetical protein